MPAITSKIPVLFLGATGYVGGTFLSRLLTTPGVVGELDLTLYVRSEEKARRLEAEFNVKTVIGTLADLDKLERASEQAHIVISIASADDVDMTKAILKGLKKRHEKLGDQPIILHTSGTGVLIDWNHKLGLNILDDIYTDLEVDRLETIPPEAIHRPVDLLFLEADKQGYARTVLVLPPTIFGAPAGVLFDKKLANTHSIQIPAIIRGAIERGRAGLIGNGQAIWDHIHVQDLAELYMILTQRLVDTPESVSHGRDGWFFAENGEHTHLDLVNRIGRELFALGALESPEPVRFLTEDEVVEKAKRERFNAAEGTNARSRALRARRELGWTPKRTVEDLWASIRPEAEIILKEMRGDDSESKSSKTRSKHGWKRLSGLLGKNKP